MTAPAHWPLLIKVSDAAFFLSTSRWTINDMCRKHELAWTPWRGSKKIKRIVVAGLFDYVAKHQVLSAEQLRAALDRRYAAHPKRRAAFQPLPDAAQSPRMPLAS